MSKKMSLNDLYTASRRLIDFGKEICKLPTKIYPPHYCPKCGTELHNVYMENRVYLVACPNCDTITLVEAVSPMNALMKVGNIDGSNWTPVSIGWPDKPGRYLVTYREWSNGNYLPEYEDTTVKILNYSCGIFNLPRCFDPEAEDDMNRQVIAWMHLPKIYKSDDEEELFY